jgi:hypothetical protein
MTDLSESGENEKQKLTLPLIVEPEHDENSFDLMRHLRLNQVQRPEHLHGRILLEPVTEELEVSSVGSGSVRTVKNTQQDSLDSLGNASVLTKISRKQESEDSVQEQIVLDHLSTSFHEDTSQDIQLVHLQPTEENELIENDKSGDTDLDYDSINRHVNIENANKDTQTSTGDNESGISSACEQESVNLNVPGLRLPILRALSSQTKHDSFELEEIATSDENLDKIEDKRSIGKNNNERTRPFRRENSDESSGFEDDTQIKKRSTENLIVDDVKLSSLENQDDSNLYTTKSLCKNDRHNSLLVPFESSTPTNEAEGRRSAFAKRSSWSTSKQKRVVFQDDLSLKSRSLEDRNNSVYYKVDTQRYSLDIPLTQTRTETRKDLSAKTLAPSDKDTSKDHPTRTTLEQQAVNNIRKFMSCLMSIRSKFRNQQHDDVVSTPDDSPKSLPSTSGTPSVISIEPADSSNVTVLSYTEPQVIREESGSEIACVVSGEAYQVSRSCSSSNSFLWTNNFF